MAWMGRFDDFDTVQQGNNNTGPRSNMNMNMDNSASTPISIQDLKPGMMKTVLTGVIISKEEPREVMSKKSTTCQTRHLLNFTLRDSPSWYINATCWGEEDFIKNIGIGYHIGDIVEVSNPQIQTKPTDGTDRFKPWTPSGFHLSLSDKYSALALSQNWDPRLDLHTLQHIPIRPSNDFYVIGDILTNGQDLNGEHVNLLVAVKNVGPIKETVTKTGRQVKRCEVKLFDETCNSFSLTLWDDEVISLAQSWNAGEYVISIIDAKVRYDDYRQTMTATADCRTIFIVNPDTKEAHNLYKFAQAHIMDDDFMTELDEHSSMEKDPDLSEIRTVLTVSQTNDLMQEIKDGSTTTSYCIVYAYVTSLDLDNENSSKLLRFKCTSCGHPLTDREQACINPMCVSVSTTNPSTASYNIAINISDHTGTLHSCHMVENNAEAILGCNAESFMSCGGDMLTNRKWQYLLERCKIYMKVQKSRQRNVVFKRILSCELVSPEELQSALQRLM